MQHLLKETCMHTMRGHNILTKRIITSRLHVDVLPVARFVVPKYLADIEGDHAIEAFLLITIFTLASSFGLVFKMFREVCVCVFLASGYGWGAVMHEIPISSPPSQ
jgi:hypothetical protein